jgi:hypothetical protein
MCDSWEEAKKKADKTFSPKEKKDESESFDLTDITKTGFPTKQQKNQTRDGLQVMHTNYWVHASTTQVGETFKEDGKTWKVIYNGYTKDDDSEDYRFAAVLVDQDEGGSE